MTEKKKRKRTVTRNYRKDTIKDPTEEQLDEAYKEANKLAAIHKNDPSSRDPSPHGVLPGVTKHSGNIIQNVVALRIQGLRDIDIGKMVNTTQKNISRLELEYPEAFHKAKVVALDNAAIEYEGRLWTIRAALSEAGPKMVEVLVSLAENEDVQDNVRRDSAIAVLNLLGVGYQRTSRGGRDGKLSGGATNVFVQQISEGVEGLDDCRIVDAESAEVIHE